MKQFKRFWVIELVKVGVFALSIVILSNFSLEAQDADQSAEKVFVNTAAVEARQSGVLKQTRTLISKGNGKKAMIDLRALVSENSEWSCNILCAAFAANKQKNAFSEEEILMAVLDAAPKNWAEIIECSEKCNISKKDDVAKKKKKGVKKESVKKTRKEAISEKQAYDYSESDLEEKAYSSKSYGEGENYSSKEAYSKGGVYDGAKSSDDLGAELEVSEDLVESQYSSKQERNYGTDASYSSKDFSGKEGLDFLDTSGLLDEDLNGISGSGGLGAGGGGVSIVSIGGGGPVSSQEEDSSEELTVVTDDNTNSVIVSGGSTPPNSSTPQNSSTTQSYPTTVVSGENCVVPALSSSELAWFRARGYSCEMLRNMSRSELDKILYLSGYLPRLTCGDEMAIYLLNNNYNYSYIVRLQNTGKLAQSAIRLGYCSGTNLSRAEKACLLNKCLPCSVLQAADSSGGIGRLLENSDCGTCGDGMDDDLVECLLSKGYTCSQINALVNSGAFGEVVVALGCCSVPSLDDDELACLINAGYTCTQIKNAVSSGVIDSLLSATSCGDTTTTN